MTLYIKDFIVPQKWLDIHSILSNVSKKVLIAGGCFRDMDNHRPIKDIDIFIEAFKEINAIPGYTKTKSSDVSGTEYECDNTLMTIEEWTAIDDSPSLNIIFVNEGLTLEERFARFDFGLCKIGYDGVAVKSHPHYQEDKTNHRFTLRRADNPEQIRRSLERHAKFLEKYHKWELVIPPEYHKAVQDYVRSKDQKAPSMPADHLPPVSFGRYVPIEDLFEDIQFRTF